MLRTPPRTSRLSVLAAALVLPWLVTACATRDPGPPERVVHLDQGIDRETLGRMHFTPQGTVIMPTAWIAALEAGPFTTEPLMGPASMRRFGFITADTKGPDALDPFGFPIGFASTATAGSVEPGNPDEARTVTMTGFTCAACHTGQLDYQGTAIRIEGGQASHDAVAFQSALGTSIIATWLIPTKYARFRERAVALGYPEDLIDKRFGEAFDAAWDGFRASLAGETGNYPVVEGHGRLDALQRIANTLFGDDLHEPANYRDAEAPVSFPPLWDIWLFDMVQYNASVRQPMIRNVGEALGVRAQTRFIGADGTPNEPPERWRSSVRVRDIDWIERTLQRLQPPAWPADVLPPIDETKAAAGRELFDAHCAACHAIVAVTDRPMGTDDAGNPLFEWHTPVIALDKIGTDPQAAVAFARNRYDASRLGIDEPLSGADGLRVVTEEIKNEAYRTEGIAEAQWPEFDGFARENLVASPCGYRARPLVGIWATPPFLHNGSVPSLMALLSEDRPVDWPWGRREFDPVTVGLALDPFPGSRAFDVTEIGNDNGGHWFTDDRSRKGRIGPALDEDERLALLEYLKAASLETYPVRTITAARIRAAPCADDPDWADPERS